MKKKALIIIGICVFILALLVAMYFTFFKMDYTYTENGYTTSYKGSGSGNFIIKVEKDSPLTDCYFHIRNRDGELLAYEIKDQKDNSITLKITGLSEGTGAISLFINEDPENLEEVIYDGESEVEPNDEDSLGEEDTSPDEGNLEENNTEENITEENITEETDIEEEIIEPLFYYADMLFDIESDLNIILLDCGITSQKDPELIFEKGEFKLFAQNLTNAYRLIVPNSKKGLSFVEEGYNIIEIANTQTNDEGKTYATIVGHKLGSEKVLCSSPYDNVNVVLQFGTTKSSVKEGAYDISLISYDGSDDVDISMFFDGTDYSLMATTLNQLPIPLRANINEYKVMSKTYDEGNEICVIDLVYNYREMSYVVTEKVTLDELLVDVNQMMTNANIPLVEETINGIDVKYYEYAEGSETFSLMYFTVDSDVCMLTSDEATIEEMKPFIENLLIKDLSKYQETEEQEIEE